MPEAFPEPPGIRLERNIEREITLEIALLLGNDRATFAGEDACYE